MSEKRKFNKSKLKKKQIWKVISCMNKQKSDV